MKRRLIGHASVALLCGAIVFAILSVAAWYNLRGERNVCRRQGYTRMTLRIIGKQLEEYRDQRGSYPDFLADVPDLRGSWTKPIGPSTDEWGNLIQYRKTGSSFHLYSRGRDGQPGGIGLDADIFHDGRDREQSLATFSQYFGETDQSEVDRGSVVMDGLVAGCMVAFITFGSLNNWGRSGKTWKPVSFIVNALAIICISVLIGCLLLPLHIPNGH